MVFHRTRIRTLGELIVKVHIKISIMRNLSLLKSFITWTKLPSLKAFDNLGDGNINWREVREGL